MLTPTYIFDSSRLFRDGTRLILSAASFEVVGMGETLSDLHTLPKVKSVALFVVGNPVGIHVLDFIESILAINKLARIVVLVDSYDHRASAAILERGAKGYLHKNLSAESFIKALQLIAEECSVISGWPVSHGGRGPLSMNLPLSAQPAAAAPLAQVEASLIGEDVPVMEHSTDHDDTGSGAEEVPHGARAGLRIRNLSPRETAILKLVMSGESNKQIARELDIMESTVKVHIKTILRKIDVKNRTQAAIWAMADPDFMPSSQH